MHDEDEVLDEADRRTTEETETGLVFESRGSSQRRRGELASTTVMIHKPIHTYNQHDCGHV